MTRGFSYKRILMSDLGATNDMVGNSYNGPSYKAFNNFEQVVDGLGKPAAWICHGHYKSTKDVSGQNFTYDMRTNTRLHLTSHVGYAANETKSTFGPSNSGGIGYLIAMVIRTID